MRRSHSLLGLVAAAALIAGGPVSNVGQDHPFVAPAAAQHPRATGRIVGPSGGARRSRWLSRYLGGKPCLATPRKLQRRALARKYGLTQ